MSRQPIKLDTKEWRGNRLTNLGAFRKYDFPVTTFRIGPNGERVPVETPYR